MKQLKRIVIAIIGTVLFFVAIDLAGGLVCDKLYRKAKYSIYARQNYVLEKSTDDVIILGSSRAAHHYIPTIITDFVGLSCYNAGSDGMCIFYHFGVLSAMIERGHKPKMVIYDVIESDILRTNSAQFSLEAAVERFAPVYGESKAIDLLVSLKGKLELLKFYSALYRYNSHLVQLIRCNCIPQSDELGYERLDGVLKIEEKDEVKDAVKLVEIDALKVEYFKKLIQLCNSNDISLSLVYSPKYSKRVLKDIDIVHEIANEYNVPFYSMTNELVFKDEKMFKDMSHLNHDGATLFTNMIVHEIKRGER